MKYLTLKASKLGWLPGHWPLNFTFEGTVYTRTSVVPIPDGCDEDTYIYASDKNTSLTVGGEHLDPEGLDWEEREWPLVFEDLDGTQYDRGEMITQDAYPNSETEDFLGYEYVKNNGDTIKVYSYPEEHEND